MMNQMYFPKISTFLRAEMSCLTPSRIAARKGNKMQTTPHNNTLYLFDWKHTMMYNAIIDKEENSYR